MKKNQRTKQKNWLKHIASIKIIKMFLSISFIVTETGFFYVESNGLIRLWEKLAGYYVNGIYTAERSRHNF